MVERSTAYVIRLKWGKKRQRILYKQYYSTFVKISQVILKFIIMHKIKVIVLLDVVYLSISKHTNFEVIYCRFNAFCNNFHITDFPTLPTHQAKIPHHRDISYNNQNKQYFSYLHYR